MKVHHEEIEIHDVEDLKKKLKLIVRNFSLRNKQAAREN